MGTPIDIKSIPKEDIKGYECRHATFCGDDGRGNDLHVVKEYIHLKDGTRIPNVRLIPNFEREFWVTREGFQDHQEKKEYEKLDRVKRYATTQSKMPDAVSRALKGRPAMGTPLRQLAESPYLYGCDISSTALLKKQYETKYPECVHPSSTVAVLDIETDVVSGHGEIILITLSYKDRVYTAINTQFLKRSRDPIRHVQSLFNKHLGDVKEARGIELELGLFDTAAECCKAVIAKAHEWKPDFVTVWNINFDLPKIMKTLTKAGADLADVFSDPSVPPEFRFFKYKEGRTQKVTQGGKVMSTHPADRWHTVTCPASFYFVDAMCLYKKLRAAKGNEPSYSLDYILNKFLGKGKLSLPEADKLDGLPWHRYMQTHQPFFYVVYNIFDCVSVEMLDEITNDISSAFPSNCGNSDFSNFTSNPRRIMDDLHYFYLERGGVVGTTGVDMTDGNDEHVIGLDEWIITLPSHLVADNGLNLIEGYETLRSMMRIHLADLDIEGTYPSIEMVANISKETTLREMGRIRDMSEADRRVIGINMSGGVVNAVEILNQAVSVPTLSQWLDLVDEFDAEEQKETA